MNLLHGKVYIVVPWLAGWLPLPEALTEGRKKGKLLPLLLSQQGKTKKRKKEKKRKRERES